MNGHSKLLGVAVMVGALTSQVHAVELFWSGGTAGLVSPSYTDGTNTGLSPTSGDILDIGAGGTATYSVAGPISFQKLRVGHIQGAAGVQGDGTVTINNGAQVSLTVGATGSAAASLWVGNGKNGTLNLDGSGTSLTSQQVIVIGYGDDATVSGTVNVTNGASLMPNSGNLNIGDSIIGAGGTGTPGHLNMSDSGSAITVLGTSDLQVGVRAGSSYVQSDGLLAVGDQIVVGQNTAANSTLTITGGTVAAGGAFSVGQNNATGSSISISGGSLQTGAINVGANLAQNSSFAMSNGTLTSTGAVTVGANTAHGSSFNISGGSTIQATGVTIGNAANNVTGSLTGTAILNIPNNNFNVGIGASQNATFTLADGAAINVTNTAASTGNVFIGRGTSTGATFNMTGGTVNTGRNFLLGNADAAGATGIVGNQSGGTITTALNFVVTDLRGASTYNLSGNGAIVANGAVVVGRQVATGTMNQTGGTVTAATGVSVGNAQNTDTTLWGTGIYNLSGGTMTANVVTGTALAIAPQGTGTFRVIGDDATIDVNGDMVVNAGGGAQGTLAYQLETGDQLSQIDVSGNATFAAGAILSFDTSLATPTQTSYNLLTALDIVDNGISFNVPGWSYSIVSGGNGEILKLTQSGPVGVQGDYNNNGVVDAADYVLWRNGGPIQNEVTGTTPGMVTPEDYTAWRARFGSTSGSGSGTAAVPEPMSAVLFAVFASGLLLMRHRNS